MGRGFREEKRCIRSDVEVCAKMASPYRTAGSPRDRLHSQLFPLPLCFTYHSVMMRWGWVPRFTFLSLSLSLGMNYNTLIIKSRPTYDGMI